MISTHALDLELGRPAAGLLVRLERMESETPSVVFEGRTDADGRVRPLLADPAPGRYRLTAALTDYFSSARPGFFTDVSVTFVVDDPAGHYHVPFLIARAACSSYRGS